jgi:hypothetical protein
LNAKAATAHNHAGTDITSGTVGATRLPAFSTVAQGVVPASTTATGSQVLADNGWKKINNLYTAFTVLTDAMTVVWDMNVSSYNAKVTLAGNRTLSITNAVNGMSGCLIVIQDGTGGRTLVAPAGSYVAGGHTSFTLSSIGGRIDILTFVFDGTNYFWTITNNYVVVI